VLFALFYVKKGLADNAAYHGRILNGIISTSDCPTATVLVFIVGEINLKNCGPFHCRDVFNEKSDVLRTTSCSVSNGGIRTVRTDTAVVVVPSEIKDVFVAALDKHSQC